jgi:hypothetical protein
LRSRRCPSRRSDQPGLCIDEPIRRCRNQHLGLGPRNKCAGADRDLDLIEWRDTEDVLKRFAARSTAHHLPHTIRVVVAHGSTEQSIKLEVTSSTAKCCRDHDCRFGRREAGPPECHRCCSEEVVDSHPNTLGVPGTRTRPPCSNHRRRVWSIVTHRDGLPATPRRSLI